MVLMVGVVEEEEGWKEKTRNNPCHLASRPFDTS